MMKRNLLLALALAVVAGAWAAGLGGVVTSPGGNLAFSMEQRGGKLLYNITYKGKTVVTGGQLGVSIDNHLVESAMGIPTHRSPVDGAFAAYRHRHLVG